MDNQFIPKDIQQNKWISITGYRTLFILRILMESPKTLNEIIEILKQNPVIQKSLSKDTIRIAINTLKKAGCNISKPTRTNGYKYELVSHPFTLDFSKDEIKTLLKLRNMVCEEIDWQNIFIINDIYEKIAELTMNEKIISEFNSSRPLNKLNTRILWEIEAKNYINKNVFIDYYSPKNGYEELEVIPKEIKYEKGKLYLVCFILKYKKNSIINFERIRKIFCINMNNASTDKDCFDATFKLLNNAVDEYIPEEGETIIEKGKDYIIIKARVNNEFKFIQRLLSFGCDFRIISPASLKAKVLEKLKLIQKGYE